MIAILPFLAVFLASATFPSHADSYEAPLPPQLATDANLCAYVPCQDVIPGAETFSPRKGKPSYVEAYAGKEREEKLLGYVFLSTDIVDIPAYSGKPVVTLIGMDTKGIITGVKILKHSEPILLLGIPESKLANFIGQYVGKFAGDKIEVGKGRAEPGHGSVDAISGATVTVIAENQVMMRSAYAIASQVGIIQAAPKPQAKFTSVSEKLDWAALVKEGSVERLTIKPGDLGLEDTGEPYVDMHFGYLSEPNIGRNVLGAETYRRLMAELKANEHAIFIISSGTGSFKGSGFVRGGIFDRIQVAQGLDAFTFRDTDYLNLYGIEAAGAPAYRESSIFIIRNPAFSAAYPWSLRFLGSKVDQQTGARTFASFEREYWLPARYLEGGRPKIEQPEAAWVQAWKSKPVEIALLVFLLAGTTGTYMMRDKLVRWSTRKDKRWVEVPKITIAVISIAFVGYLTMATPSITHVLTIIHSLASEWRWELFLSDPLIFIFWCFIALILLLWGRGLFCGWLCPYGAMSELCWKITQAVGLKRFQFELPIWLHKKLRLLKYAIFVGLVATSFYSLGLAEKLSEVEPFKTTFLIGVLNRPWPYVVYWVALFGLAFFIERPFCKYLCPLGAGLAIPTTFRTVRLKRKAECGNPCQACRVGCGQLAIDKRGDINQRECLLCLECQILYYDDHTCPPLAKERRRRTKAGLPLTPIGSDGYFIPIKAIQ